MLTLEMVYHPQLAKILHSIQNAMFFLSTFLVIISLYIILKKSTKEMKIYKFMLINQILWSYSVEVVLTIMQIGVLFPIFMMYSGGILQIFGPNVIYVMAIMFLLALAGNGQSVGLCIAYRLVGLFTSFSIVDNKKFWLIFGLCFLAFLEIINLSNFNTSLI